MRGAAETGGKSGAAWAGLATLCLAWIVVCAVYFSGTLPSIRMFAAAKSELLRFLEETPGPAGGPRLAVVDVNARSSASNCGFDKTIGRSRSDCLADLLDAAARADAKVFVLDVALPSRAIEARTQGRSSFNDERFTAALLSTRLPVVLLRQSGRGDGVNAPFVPVDTAFDWIDRPNIHWASPIFAGEEGRSDRWFDALATASGSPILSAPFLTARLVGVEREPRIFRPGAPFRALSTPVPTADIVQQFHDDAEAPIVVATPDEALRTPAEPGLHGRIWVVGSSQPRTRDIIVGAGDAHRSGLEHMARAIYQAARTRHVHDLDEDQWRRLAAGIAIALTLIWSVVRRYAANDLLDILVAVAVAAGVVYPLSILLTRSGLQPWEAADLIGEAVALAFAALILYALLHRWGERVFGASLSEPGGRGRRRRLLRFRPRRNAGRGGAGD